ncbi:hypothetical protein M427DRAFT_57489 [Gonapodya prolifera JEL478]|uniref:Uncharacterized protein n=1 Tax=Gonapodya prolifera (strain JEL478) TaxID=1344416 RepID=A0A139ACW4_GONPJ|nr:hypothetical protein M427DRAFT_57489 [Gonapodya prolifera JEL478]|eukprot:KXS14588.1 hypothetical protein M427DRAFT_57489 [Gonapodya prolifera JEL478]
MITEELTPCIEEASSFGVPDKTQLHLKPRAFLTSATQSNGDSLPTGIAPKHK